MKHPANSNVLGASLLPQVGPGRYSAGQQPFKIAWISLSQMDNLDFMDDFAAGSSLYLGILSRQRE